MVDLAGKQDTIFDVLDSQSWLRRVPARNQKSPWHLAGCKRALVPNLLLIQYLIYCNTTWHLADQHDAGWLSNHHQVWQTPRLLTAPGEAASLSLSSLSLSLAKQLSVSVEFNKPTAVQRQPLGREPLASLKIRSKVLQYWLLGHPIDKNLLSTINKNAYW